MGWKYWIPGDHPRMRGEKTIPADLPPMVEGSPPHARGKVGHADYSVTANRITPACAGKSPTLAPALTFQRDHPRMRGEKLTLIYTPGKILGSPPHARGKASKHLLFSPESGITPACAGKSDPFFQTCVPGGDHPRMRGEKPCTVTSMPTEVGSPPHARGKVAASCRTHFPYGITPACAGKRHAFPEQP